MLCSQSPSFLEIFWSSCWQPLHRQFSRAASKATRSRLLASGLPVLPDQGLRMPPPIDHVILYDYTRRGTGSGRQCEMCMGRPIQIGPGFWVSRSRHGTLCAWRAKPASWSRNLGKDIKSKIIPPEQKSTETQQAVPHCLRPRGWKERHLFANSKRLDTLRQHARLHPGFREDMTCKDRHEVYSQLTGDEANFVERSRLINDLDA